MELDDVCRFGDLLHDALIKREPIAPISHAGIDIQVEDAYRIQQRMVQHRLDAGQCVVGKKVGITSKAVQDMLGVRQPDFGQILSGMAYTEDEPVPCDTFISPRAEAEVAFMLKRDLNGPGVTSADVLRATDFVLPCFEIVDSRIRDWKIHIEDTVADNASCGAFVLGGTTRTLRQLDLSVVGMVVTKNGEVVSTSAGAAVLGSPINAVVWLANALGRLGMPIRAGEVILSGSQSPLLPVVRGDVLRCDIGGLGGCNLRFC